MNTSADRKFFTVEEANQMLPLVRAIVGDIVKLYRDVHERRQRLVRIRQLPGAALRDDESVYSEELRQIEDELDKDVCRLEEFVTELRDLGVELKDPLAGLIDFPAVIDGREVYLCWRLGEGEIGYWHDFDAGFSGRQSLFEKSVPGEGATQQDEDSL